jgi:NAD(P)-dependent dehydrogenase (short-subunit alcohol dehydrogenase family)
VAVLARGPQRLQQTVEELKQRGAADALGLQVDVSDPQQVENAATRIEEKLGPIDVWVNNAMTTVFAPFKAVSRRILLARTICGSPWRGTSPPTAVSMTGPREGAFHCTLLSTSAGTRESLPLRL